VNHCLNLARWRIRLAWSLAGIAALIVFYLTFLQYFADREIALIMGEPWDDMRRRSTAPIAQALPGHYWGLSPETDARLRFVDEQYGFITPVGNFFIITFDNEKVVSAVIYPQTQPLLIDDAFEVVLGIQQQFKSGGWFPIYSTDNPPFADTPEWRIKVRDAKNGQRTYWQAGEKYQAKLSFNRFKDNAHPDQERYKIILNVSGVWMPSEAELDNITLKPYLCKKPCPKEIMESF
jgi:hypothetical protein